MLIKAAECAAQKLPSCYPRPMTCFLACKKKKNTRRDPDTLVSSWSAALKFCHGPPSTRCLPGQVLGHFRPPTEIAAFRLRLDLLTSCFWPALCPKCFCPHLRPFFQLSTQVQHASQGAVDEVMPCNTPEPKNGCNHDTVLADEDYAHPMPAPSAEVPWSLVPHQSALSHSSSLNVTVCPAPGPLPPCSSHMFPVPVSQLAKLTSCKKPICRSLSVSIARSPWNLWSISSNQISVVKATATEVRANVASLGPNTNWICCKCLRNHSLRWALFGLSERQSNKK